MTRLFCGKQKDTSSVTNTRQPTFLHFSSTLHVHPLFRTKQNRLMLLTAPLPPDTHHETCIRHRHAPASNILCFYARQTAVGLLLQRERTRDGIEGCRVYYGEYDIIYFHCVTIDRDRIGQGSHGKVFECRQLHPHSEVRLPFIITTIFCFKH